MEQEVRAGDSINADDVLKMQDLKREIAKKEAWDLTKNIKSLEINVKEYQESSASGIVEVLLPILRKELKKIGWFKCVKEDHGPAHFGVMGHHKCLLW